MVHLLKMSDGVNLSRRIFLADDFALCYPHHCYMYGLIYHCLALLYPLLLLRILFYNAEIWPSFKTFFINDLFTVNVVLFLWYIPKYIVVVATKQNQKLLSGNNKGDNHYVERSDDIFIILETNWNNKIDTGEKR